MHHRAKDITGLRVGYLTALNYAGSNGSKSLWNTRCDCGKLIVLEASELKKKLARGVRASCGCQTRATIGEKNTKHGMSAHPAYVVWRSMLDRCRLPTHHAWANYGARGIRVCERWAASFENFWADMGPTYHKGGTLERMKNSEGYSAANCRWRTRRRQANNRRGNTRIQTPLGEMTVAQAAKRYGVNGTTIHYRLASGWPTERLLEPSGTYRTAGHATGSRSLTKTSSP